MKKGRTKGMNATATRNVLAFLLCIIIVGAAAGFYFGLQIIQKYAIDVTHTVADSSASGKNIEQLGALKKQLSDGEVLVAKADALFATPETYQTQALKDISKYAAQSGVTVSSIESASGGEAPIGASAVPNYSEVITLQSPVSYVSFLKFLDAIEGNLPKMQISAISVARPDSVSGDLISADKITITVSVR